MNREDIKRIGHQVGLDPVYLAEDAALSLLVYLERFAAVVEAEAAAAEREACAKVVENHALGYAEPVWALKLIDTIRARGEPQ